MADGSATDDGTVPSRPAIAPAALAAAREYAEALRREHPGRVRLLRLFGSVARGEAHEDSDVDVAVVVDDLDRATWRQIVDRSADVGLEHEVWLSPTLFDTAAWRQWREQDRRLVRDIEEEGIAL